MHKKKNAFYTYSGRTRILLIIFIGLALAGCTVPSTTVSPLPKDEVVSVKSLSKAKKPPMDKKPPRSEIIHPHDGDTSVPISTNIVVLVQDAGSGVDLSTVIMTVEGNEVYNGANPSQPGQTGQSCQTGQYAETCISGDPSSLTISCDPNADFGSLLQINVTIEASDYTGNTMSPKNYSFMTESASGNPWECTVDDDDCDGIPNDVESTLLMTDPNTKTLFVRPKKETGFLQYGYWDEFIQLFQDVRPGFAGISAFTNAEIEISVIGDPGHPYGPMKNFNYDPAQDPNHPPCDILEIVHKGGTSYCAYGHSNYGHTSFSSIRLTWYWDTKGYVPNNQTTTHYLEHGYFTPLIYPFPLDNYLSEGAYDCIVIGQYPKVPAAGVPCSFDPYKQCYYFNYSSPMNLNATDPVCGLPDGTVEFNEINFDAQQQIIYVGAFGKPYDRDGVIGRTIVHEMGHALLAASITDHCSDPQCILYGNSVDWEMHDFGPGNCTHMPGGAKDIRADSVIHNSIH